MKNREYVNPLNRKRDTGNAREKATNPTIESPPGYHVPMNHHPYKSETDAQFKGSFPHGKVGYDTTEPQSVPPGGRGLKGYKNSTYRSDTAVFKEGGRVVKRDQVQGKVIVKTNHPNSDINKIYS